MRSAHWLSAIAYVPVLIACSQQSPPPIDVSAVDMVFWEHQSWESGGGSHRLTLWADGRSQVTVRPDAFFRDRPDLLIVREGWTLTAAGYFVRNDVFSREIARGKFQEALRKGIHLLQSFEANYVDGSGTLVGIRVNGELRETVIPMFLDQDRGSDNHNRFLDVAELMSDYDWQAYELPSR